MPLSGPGKARYPIYDTIPTRVAEKPNLTSKAKPGLFIVSNNTRNQAILIAVVFFLGWLAGR